MNGRLGKTLVAVAVAVLVAQPVSAKASMIDLGTLGGVGSSAFDINNGGQVVGYSYTAESNVYHAYRWQDGMMRDLTPPSAIVSQASAINDRGQVVGSTFGGSWAPGAPSSGRMARRSISGRSAGPQPGRGHQQPRPGRGHQHQCRRLWPGTSGRTA
jgi:probable HAF family extracellular repeat protein